MFNCSIGKKPVILTQKAIIAAAFLGLAACDGSAKLGDSASTVSNTTVVTNSSGGMSADVSASNIVETAVAAGNFNTLVTALQATGLDAVLADESSSYTVFAPTDDAFAALGSDTIAALLADPETLESILLYHVVPGAVSSEVAISLAGSPVEAANGDTLALSLSNGALFINDSEVTVADVAASNGVIHVIDAVLTPAEPEDQSGADPVTAPQGLANIVDTAVAAGSFNTLAAALQATGLDTVLSDENTHYTVFAPTDAAFAALGEDTINALLADPDTLKDILLYHVVAGTSVDAATAVGLAGTKITAANGGEFALSLNEGDLYVNLSQVTATDVFASNGVIHVIDTVLTPLAPVTAKGSVVDVAISDGRFNTLIAALQATSLDTVLADHSGIFTVFAPTDAAFAQLGDATITALLGDLPTLSNILLTHVISGATVDSVSAFAATGTSVETASGAEVALSIRDGALFVNDAKVIITDIKAENGIIHVIDSVIQ